MTSGNTFTYTRNDVFIYQCLQKVYATKFGIQFAYTCPLLRQNYVYTGL